MDFLGKMEDVARERVNIGLEQDSRVPFSRLQLPPWRWLSEIVGYPLCLLTRTGI
jgi:hypothetical protein